MKHVVLAGVLAAALAAPALAVSAQDTSKPAAAMSLGSVTLTKKVLADGQPLAAGTYQVRLSTDEPKAVAGQSPDGARYVEFLKAGKVVGRELATVVSKDDVASIKKGQQPKTGSVRVETLKGADYVRVWINRSGNNYLIHLPPA